MQRQTLAYAFGCALAYVQSRATKTTTNNRISSFTRMTLTMYMSVHIRRCEWASVCKWRNVTKMQISFRFYFWALLLPKGAKWVGNQHINRSTSLHSLNGSDPPSSLFGFAHILLYLFLLFRPQTTCCCSYLPQFFRSVPYEMVPVFIIFFIVALCASSAVILRANIQAVADFNLVFTRQDCINTRFLRWLVICEANFAATPRKRMKILFHLYFCNHTLCTFSFTYVRVCVCSFDFDCKMAIYASELCDVQNFGVCIVVCEMIRLKSLQVLSALI